VKCLIFGPQGVGKATQAGLLAPHWGVPHISTGHLFRDQIAAGTQLGRKAQEAVAAGDLVDDSVTEAMLGERLQRDDCREGFLLTGFPRNIQQAGWLNRTIAGTGGFDALILLRAPDRVVTDRALQRGRSDDTEEVISKRLQSYHRNTATLLRFYIGQFDSIDGNRPVEVVHQDILARIGDRAKTY